MDSNSAVKEEAVALVAMAVAEVEVFGGGWWRRM